jgi:hypothetical protein
MAFRDSPGITSEVKDRSLFIEPGTSSVVGMVVDSVEGPVGLKESDPAIIELNTKDDWVRNFSDPTTDLEKTANVILRATGKMDGAVRLAVKRALPRDQNDDIDALWSGADLDASGSPEVLNSLGTGEVYPYENYSPGTDILFSFFADNPGVHGDNIGVEIDPSVGASDEFRVYVYTRDDANADWVQQENHFVSQTDKTDERNRQMFIEDRINADSDLIIAVNNDNDNSDISTSDKIGITALGGGDDGSSVEKDDLVTAVQDFRSEDQELTALVHGGQASLNDSTYADEIWDITASRKDSIALIDVPYDVSVSDATSTFKSTLSTPSGSLAGTYAYLYYGWHEDYEVLTQKNVENPPSGYVAEALLISRENNRPWDPVAGLRRGRVSSEGLVRGTLDRGNRDELYNNHINYFRIKSGLGVYIDGTINQRQIEAGTKLDRMNVVLLLNFIKSNVSGFLEPFVHELNTASTRREIRNGIDSFLSGVQGREGLYNYDVVCDESNNPPNVIDSKELFVDLILSPTVVAENIKLNAHVVETGEVEFSTQFI